MKAARKRSGKTQEQVADDMTVALERQEPIHFTTISRWENGHNEPEDIATVVAYAGAVGVGDFRELLEGAAPAADLEAVEIRSRFVEALIPVADLFTQLLDEARKARDASSDRVEVVK